MSFDPLADPGAGSVDAWMDNNFARYMEQNQQLLDVRRLLGSIVPPGSIVAYGGTTAPGGWVLADGTTYDGTDLRYLALWNAIGIVYGGASQAAFQVPDLRDRQVFVKGGTNFTTVAATGGAKTATLVANQLPVAAPWAITPDPHAHDINAYTSGTESAGFGLVNPSGGFGDRVMVSNATGANTDGTALALGSNAGGGQPVTTTDPYIVIASAIVKL